MKKKRRVLPISLIVITLLIAIVLIVINTYKRSALPDYNAEINIEGLKEEVNVYRDKVGVPHIYAQNEDDLYLVTGYILAQDRLWQMDLLRRVTQGRLSEIFGKDMLDADILLRSLRMTEKSDYVMENTPDHILKQLDNFTKGINLYLEHNEKLPFEFKILNYEPEKWKTEDIMGLIGYMSWDLKTAWNTELLLYEIKNKLGDEKFAELLPDLDFQKTEIYSEPFIKSTNDTTTLLSANKKLESIAPEIFKGSNNWVIGPEKSKTGKPILCNDMHLGLTIPGVWYQIHQTVEGKFSVSGVLLPGQPFVVAGHNEDIAWGLTNVMLDGTDFYIESINPENENQYKLNGKYLDMEVVTEEIKTKEGEVVNKTLKYTHRGPIISDFKDIKDKQISMRWVGNENSNEVAALYKLNRAKNNDEFKQAVSEFKAIAQNFAYADKEGNIGIYIGGGIPYRQADGYNIFPGDTSKYDWQGLIPFDSLPHLYNPDANYVYSANNKSIGDDFEHYITQWFAMPHRANRIIQMIEEKEKLGIDDMKEIQTDYTSYLAMQMTPVILDNIDKSNLNDNELKALEILENWNYDFDREKTAPAIFDNFYLIFTKNIFADELGEEVYNKMLKAKYLVNSIIDRTVDAQNSSFIDDINTEKKESFGDIVEKSFKDCVNKLVADNESIENSKWGNYHKLKLEHPLGSVDILNRVFALNRSGLELNGSYHTVCPYSYSLTNPFLASNGASERHIFTLDDFDNSLTIIPTGQSGIPGSKYYCDQTLDYVKGNYHKHFFSKDYVLESKEYNSKFLPKE